MVSLACAAFWEKTVDTENGTDSTSTTTSNLLYYFIVAGQLLVDQQTNLVSHSLD